MRGGGGFGGGPKATEDGMRQAEAFEESRRGGPGERLATTGCAGEERSYAIRRWARRARPPGSERFRLSPVRRVDDAPLASVHPPRRSVLPSFPPAPVRWQSPVKRKRRASERRSDILLDGLAIRASLLACATSLAVDAAETCSRQPVSGSPRRRPYSSISFPRKQR